MTREQKIEWIEKASTWELIKQLDFTAGKHGVEAERYGTLDARTQETIQDEKLILEELRKRVK